MKILSGFGGWPRGPLHVALGVFDGVHLGHQALIAQLVSGALDAGGATAVASTFEPLPIEVLAPAAPPSALSGTQERCRLLMEAGAAAVAIFGFDAAFAALAPGDFARRLARAGEVRRVVVGHDFRFGRDRGGDVRLLRELGEPCGFTVDEIVPLQAAGEPVSSTRIRNALRSGAVELAAELLGRPYAVGGEVVHGERRGRGLGYPTINIATAAGRLLPGDGIYAAWIDARGRRYAAAASLGVRPTFGAGARRLEAYLLDFGGDLYGEEATATFVRRLRDELHFESAEALSAQIARDVVAARSALTA